MINRDQYRRLGSTELIVSPIGLGTVKFGRNTNLRNPNSFDLPDDKTLRRLIDQAWALGINFIDTAPAYGTSELRLGNLLTQQKQDWVICTKAGEYYENNTSRYDYSRKTTIDSIHNSLKLLRRDALDLVLIHSDGNDENIILSTDIVEALLELKAAGKIRYIGMSPKTVRGAIRALDFADVLMITLNETDISQAEAITTAQQKKVGVVIKKAMASGFADNPAQSLGFACDYPGVSSAITGTISETHLRENVEALYP